MRKDLITKGKSLTGTSDLTLLAPLKPGFVPALDAITYKSRVIRLMKTLQGGRASLHEYALQRPISDAVERVAKIHSFRVAVLEPENKVMLAVTFDGTWEAYIRVLWHKVGTLLDIIFCNTEGYVISHSAGFDAWADWVRRVQVETGFYYNTHGLTVEDAHYLRGYEALARQPRPSPGVAAGAVPAPVDDTALQLLRHHVETPEDVAWKIAHAAPQLLAMAETLRQGLQSLSVLFRLTDTYLPGTTDGDVLKRAARDLLVEFNAWVEGNQIPPDIRNQMERRFKRQLDWLKSPDADLSHPPHALPGAPQPPTPALQANLQAGILTAHQGMTHGCLLLLAVTDRLAGARLLDELRQQMATEAAPRPAGQLATNLAITYEGFRALGLSEAQLALFPQEFREGMEARASMLGDFRTNHPRRWRLPQANWHPVQAGRSAQVELNTVHLVVQLRIGSTSAVHELADPAHPLRAAVEALAGAPGTPRPGIQLLHVQALRRHQNDAGQVREHFGFADGASDPSFTDPAPGAHYDNRVPVGEFIIGHPTQADVPQPPATPAEQERQDWLGDGSFLVVRKLAQAVDVLERHVAQAAAQTGLAPALIKAKMMGRWQDGTPLTPNALPAGANDFNYLADAEGRHCPFHAHVRRANPRLLPTPGGAPARPGARPARILRRGMSYGPLYPAAGSGAAPVADGQERGLMFMAYNASLSEQFEVVQRWLSGGNSAGGHSRHSDPFLGVPDSAETRRYAFEHDGVAHHIALDVCPVAGQPAQPLVRLEWGLYLFTPSMQALKRLATVAASGLRVPPPWSVAEGEALLAQLRMVEATQGELAGRQAWKAALEDPEAVEKFRAASLWAAIREKHAGSLRTPYGLLVADRHLALQVLSNAAFTAAGYRERMGHSLGEIYLGLDANTDGQYERLSEATNKALYGLPEEGSFHLARTVTQRVLGVFVNAEMENARKLGAARWELNIDVKEIIDVVLAKLCQAWFGLPDDPKGTLIVPGSWRWDWKPTEPPIYPVQFTAPSRYIFQPWPNEAVAHFGQAMGSALTAALARWVAQWRDAGQVPKAPLAQAIHQAFPEREHDGLVARTLSGALMGFLPTVDGAFRGALNEWLREGTFWPLRQAWAALPPAASHAELKAVLSLPLMQAMQLRPTPELVWRRARGGGQALGKEVVRPGETVVVALVSAAQQSLAEGVADVSMVFGGARGGEGAPTHACPGRGAAMGVMMGMAAGLLDCTHSLRASPVPLAFTLEGDVPAV